MRLRRVTRRPPGGFRLPTRDEFFALLGYVAAGVLYVLIGLLITDFLFSVFVGIGYLLLVAWLVPAAVRRAP